MDPYGSDAVMSHEIYQGSSLGGERRDEDTPSYVPLQSESLKFDKSPSLFLKANVVSSTILKLKLFFEKKYLTFRPIYSTPCSSTY